MRFVGCLWAGWLFCVALPANAAPNDPNITLIESALMAQGNGDKFPSEAAPKRVSLPDDWWESRPREDGPMWYRMNFDAPASTEPLLAVFIERACSNVEIYLNGSIIYSGGRMAEPVTRNCYYPQIAVLPTGLLRMQANVLDVKVQGYALQKVSSRQRAGGMSAVKVGPYEPLRRQQQTLQLWNVTAVKVATAVTATLGLFILFLGWLNRQEAHLTYFGLMTLTWNLLSIRTWWQNLPLDNGMAEFLFPTGFAVLVALAVQFLLSYCSLRSRAIEAVLLAQCLLVPATLIMAGPHRLFDLTNAWYLVMALEVVGAVGLYLYTVWKSSARANFWQMASLLFVACVLLLVERARQYNLITLPNIHLVHFALPLAFLVIGSRQLMGFARALDAAETARNSLESRVAEASAEMERNYVQMAEMRVAQVTETERKRIAGDLHDDLGAKLLTIVHTSESERISTLAREALEEMRLSVRGLTGRPLSAADALADWRAETVSRLGQAGVEIDWRSPTEEVTQQLSARAFVQTTRILREAISNVIKHSGASHCKVRCTMGQQEFVLVIQDNGRGIPMELDGKLDRGHGMASMKHRAKQMQGQCLVESGPGYGTVIRLTLPLGTA